MHTLIILGVFAVCICAAFIAGIAVEARYGKNKYVSLLATEGERLLPAAPVAAAPAFATPVVAATGRTGDGAGNA